MTKMAQSRFATVTSDEISKINEEAIPDNTKRSIQDGSQNLVRGFIPGATLHNCNLNFKVSFGGSSSK